MPTLHDLLSKGYFPRELPPPFSTVSFATAVAGAAGIPSGFTGTGAPKSAELCVHNMVRAGGLRRHLGIPNPIHYTRLSDFVVRNWASLHPFATRSSFSLTTPVEGKGERAISPQHTLDDRTAKRAEIRASAKFILRTDVNRFYPSIYTHSIPWAIHGKSTVKTAMAAKKLKSLWSDELDTHARSLNDNQTMGIPIGPDCSLLFAEIVLGAVDAELVSQKNKLRGIRFIDDYEFAANQRSEAEETASLLQSVLSQYELALNPSKTQIIELPEPLEPLWTSRIRTYLFRFGASRTQRNDLTAYFDTTFDLARKQPNEGILKYAVARMNSIEVTKDNWPLYEHLLCHCALVEPACLPQVCEQMIHYVTEEMPVDTALWTECLNRIVCERLTIGQASESVWAMWLMRLLNIELSSLAAKAVDVCEDSPAALMGLGLASEGLAKIAELSRLNTFAESDEMSGQNWLLCYEGNHRGWMKPPSGNDAWSANPLLDHLHKSNVSFFDITTTPPPPRRLTAEPVYAGGGGGGGEYPI